MGSCFSKCKPKKKLVKEEDPGHGHVPVHDKLVVSRDPPPEMTKLPLHKPLSPASSTASFSSFSCSVASKHCAATAASSVSSSSSSLSSSSSSSYSTCGLKDRSFSNEFLLSCAKENPHAVGLNVETTALFPNKILSQNLPLASTPKKRARAASPTLVRQKSFRKEQNSPSRGLRSPSPSRRFNGDGNGNRIFPVKENYYRKPVVSRGNNAVTSAPSFRAPNRELSISREYSVRKSDALCEQISSKINGRDQVDVVMEDINNPLIALDCFIFL